MDFVRSMKDSVNGTGTWEDICLELLAIISPSAVHMDSRIALRGMKKKSISWTTLYLKPNFSKELYYFQVTYYGP